MIRDVDELLPRGTQSLVSGGRWVFVEEFWLEKHQGRIDCIDKVNGKEIVSIVAQNVYDADAQFICAAHNKLFPEILN